MNMRLFCNSLADWCRQAKIHWTFINKIEGPQLFSLYEIKIWEAIQKQLNIQRKLKSTYSPMKYSAKNLHSPANVPVWTYNFITSVENTNHSRYVVLQRCNRFFLKQPSWSCTTPYSTTYLPTDKRYLNRSDPVWLGRELGKALGRNPRKKSSIYGSPCNGTEQERPGFEAHRLPRV